MANPILSNGVGSPQSIYEQYSVTGNDQQRIEGHHAVGTRAYLPDGRVFYYASVGDSTYGDAVVRGNIVISSTSVVTGHVNIALDAVRGVGSTVISFVPTTTDIPANFYKDGYCYINDAAGEGQMWKIKNHPEADVSASDSLRIELYDSVAVALTTASEVSLIRNPYDRVGPIGATAEAAVPAGVPLVTGTVASAVPATDVSAATNAVTQYFLWLQTWGYCPVLVGDTSAIGIEMAVGSTASDVEIVDRDALGETPIGIMVHTGVDSEYKIVDLRIRP